MKNLDSVFAAYLIGWGIFFLFYLTIAKRTSDLRAEVDRLKVPLLTKEPASQTPGQPAGQKQRDGCLTAYLIFMIVINSATALLYLVGSDAIRRESPNMPGWAFPVLIVLGIFNLVCAVALFKWKKWGFWGFVASAAVAFCLNLYVGVQIGFAIFGLLGVAILYGVLQLGKEKKAWPQLD
jgi:hypothetical protein